MNLPVLVNVPLPHHVRGHVRHDDISLSLERVKDLLLDLKVSDISHYRGDVIAVYWFDLFQVHAEDQAILFHHLLAGNLEPPTWGRA